MRRQLVTGLLMTVVLTVLLGVAYPLAVTAASQLAFHDRANGSLVKEGGKVVGSSLLGETFLDKDGNPDPRYFQPRPSAAGSGYDGLASSGSNLGPSNPKLIAPASGPDCYLVDKTDAKGNPVTDASGKTEQECSTDTVAGRADAYRQLNGLGPSDEVPVDAVTASGSGLDPAISPANARIQARRVADARNLPVDRVLQLVAAHTQTRPWGFLGEDAVNVVTLNLALDQLR